MLDFKIGIFVLLASLFFFVGVFYERYKKKEEKNDFPILPVGDLRHSEK
jgi:hypothetical protein